MKNIQISEDLFRALVLYHLADIYQYDEFIKSALEEKLIKVSRREEYTRRLHE